MHEKPLIIVPYGQVLYGLLLAESAESKTVRKYAVIEVKCQQLRCTYNGFKQKNYGQKEWVKAVSNPSSTINAALFKCFSTFPVVLSIYTRLPSQFSTRTKTFYSFERVPFAVGYSRDCPHTNPSLYSFDGSCSSNLFVPNTAIFFTFSSPCSETSLMRSMSRFFLSKHYAPVFPPLSSSCVPVFRLSCEQHLAAFGRSKNASPISLRTSYSLLRICLDTRREAIRADLNL